MGWDRLAKSIQKTERLRSVTKLYVSADWERSAVRNKEKTIDDAIAKLRLACLDFLKETEPTNKGGE